MEKSVKSNGSATHQAALLAVMATAGSNPMTLDQLDALLPIGRKQIATAAAKLIQRCFAERLETGVYKLTSDGLAALMDGAPLKSGPHRGKRQYPHYADTLRSRAWRAMRLEGRFTVRDIALLAATEADGEAEGNIRRFCHQLMLCGYLVQLPAKARGEKMNSPGFVTYRLVRDTGMAAPQYRAKDKGFYDRNTRDVFTAVKEATPCA